MKVKIKIGLQDNRILKMLSGSLLCVKFELNDRSLQTKNESEQKRSVR